jgi:hypothetical protein
MLNGFEELSFGFLGFGRKKLERKSRFALAE